MTIGNTVADLFGVKTYETEYQQKNMENEILSQRVAKLTVDLENANAQLDFYKLSDENKLKIMREDIKGLADQYIKNIQIYQELSAKCSAMIDDMEDKLKRMYNRGKAEGRQNAYSDMGIWNIEAHENGNRLVMDACGSVFELLELQDVKPDGEASGSDDEIIIDDLVDVGA